MPLPASRIVQDALQRYRACNRGAVAPLIGLSIVVLIGMIGMAIDIGRAQLVEAKLLNSLDAAGLAAGARLNTADVNSEVQRFVASNFPEGYADATITNVSGTLSEDQKTLSLTGTAVVPTTFMKVLGYNSVDVTVNSEITRDVTGLELVMTLDNTGSMSGDGIRDLKAAAKDLLGILFGDDETADNLFVGVVPFAATVNIGSARTSWLAAGAIDAHDWGPAGYGWGGCVMARYGAPNLDVSDDLPSDRAFQPFYWEDNDDYTGDRNRNDWKSGTTYFTPFSITRGPNRHCPVAVTPLTPTKSAVEDAIDAMSANGYTHINLGAVWGWRMLSPAWRGLWGGTMDANNLPLDYNTPNMNKAIVIMTDGDNRFSSSAKTGYGWLSQGNIGATTSDLAEDSADQRLIEVCTAMKNAGIFIYTITYGTDVTSSTRSLMRSCASQNDFYFDAPAGSELNTAFKKIGDSLSNLRVSK